MIKDQTILRPRYGEVDQMGYVYHGNYVNYCHQARTELMRKLGIEDKQLESLQIMMPVITMNLHYHKPAGYDDELIVHTLIDKMPATRMHFRFKIVNRKKELICDAETIVVFVNSKTRKPLRTPPIVKDALEPYFVAVSL